MRISKKVIFTSILCLLLISAAFIWHNAAIKFEELSTDLIEKQKEQPFLKIKDYTISKYFFKISLQDIEIEVPANTVSYFRHPYISWKFQGKQDIQFNPFNKKLTFTGQEESKTDFVFGNFKESFYTPELTEPAKITLGYSSYPNTILDLLQNLVSIETSARNYAAVLSDKTQILKLDSAQSKIIWNIDEKDYLDLNINNSLKGYNINIEGMKRLCSGILKEISQYIDDSNIISEIDSQLSFALNAANTFPIDDDASMHLNLDWEKLKDLYREKFKNIKKAEDLPEFYARISQKARFRDYERTGDYQVKADSKGQLLDITDNIKVTGKREDIAEEFYNFINYATQKKLVIDKETFLSGFPDLVKVNPFKFKFHIDGNFVGTFKLDNLKFLADFSGTGISLEGAAPDLQQVAAKTDIFNPSVFIDALAALAAWSIESVVFNEEAQQSQFLAAVPLYRQQLLKVIEKVGQQKDDRVSFDIKGDSTGFIINGKSIEEWLPVIIKE